MDWIVAILIVLIGAALALQRSSWAVDYAIIVFVFNRGLRRILDWQASEFNVLSPISLTPLVVACFMFIPFFAGRDALSPRLAKVFTYFAIGLGYAFVLGFIRVRLSAVYVLAEFLAPLALFGFAVTSRAPTDVRNRWIRTMAWCAILASVYGWYQYLTIPPWDAFWVRSVGFEGYLGVLKPKEISVFSTMHERGMLAGYLGLAAVAMIVSPRWRTFLSWPGVLLVLSCILLTLSRGGFIFTGIGVLSFLLINRGAAIGRILAALAVVAFASQYALEYLPGSERIQKRFASLKNMEKDGSAKGRIEIFRWSISTILTHPLGHGLGATGFAARINTGDIHDQGEHGGVITDAGYAEFFLTFGWVGGAFFIAGVLGIWREMSLRFRVGMRNEGLLLGRALMVGLIPMFLVGNMLSGISLFWLSFGVALSPLPRLKRQSPKLDASEDVPPPQLVPTQTVD